MNAFPTPVYEWNDEISDYLFAYVENGMTLRDYFAAKAVQCFAIPVMYGVVEGSTETGDATVAKRAYELADAMLKARQE